MSQNNYQKVAFRTPGKSSFHQAVTTEVENFLKANKISPYANGAMWFKTAIMLLLFYTPYSIIISGAADDNLWLFYFLWFFMGLGMVGIGTCIIHDAHHGSYSSNKKINTGIGYVLEAVGGFAVTWKIQHNYLHHIFTNVKDHDEDIDVKNLLRMSPKQPRKSFHRYQHLYFWTLYMLLTLHWMTIKDFTQAIRYHRYSLLKRYDTNLVKTLLSISIFKIIYYGYIMALPIYLNNVEWYHVVSGFLIMHAIAGLMLSFIFQLAHIVESSDFREPENEDGKMIINESWAVHEVKNTCNFAPNKRLLTWYLGGLNYQIEHHLFAGICHVHYPRLAPVVKSVVTRYGLPYNETSSLPSAIRSHIRMLKKLGRE